MRIRAVMRNAGTVARQQFTAAAATAGIVVFAVALWAQSGAMIGVFYDDGMYVLLGKALAEGEGYRSVHLPGSPAAVHYPPLYPMVLSLLWRLWPAFPSNATLFELFDSAALGIAAWLVAKHARLAFAPRWVIAAVVVAGFTAFPMLSLVSVRFSEPTFLALAALAVLSADGTDRGWRQAVVVGVAGGLSLLTRSIGVAVVAGTAAHLLFSGRKRDAGIAVATAGLIVLPWNIWLWLRASEVHPLLVSNYGTYGQLVQQSGLDAVLAGFNWRVLEPVGQLLLPDGPTWWLMSTRVALAALLVWGGVRLRKRVPALIWTLAFYLAVVLFWPFAAERFVWAIIPWVFLLIWAALRDLWQRGSLPAVVVSGIVVAIAIGFGPREFVSLRERRFAAAAAAASTNFNILTAGIRLAVPEDAVIASDGEALVSLYTNRKTVPLYFFRFDGRAFQAAGIDSVRAFLCESGAKFAAVSGRGRDLMTVLDELRETHPEGLPEVFSVTDGPALYELPC